jgi:hypothetical protein
MTNLTHPWHIMIMAVHILTEAACYFWNFCLAFCGPRAKMSARLLAVESQLAVYQERIRLKKNPRPRFTPAFRMLWVLLSKVLDGWENLAQVMQPATVKKWHTRGYKPFWRWKSRPGRPKISRENP